jgi:hypothetical protein
MQASLHAPQNRIQECVWDRVLACIFQMLLCSTYLAYLPVPLADAPDHEDQGVATQSIWAQQHTGHSWSHSSTRSRHNKTIPWFRSPEQAVQSIARSNQNMISDDASLLVHWCWVAWLLLDAYLPTLPCTYLPAGV